MIVDFANTPINTDSIKFTTTFDDPSVDWYRNFISKQMSGITDGSILKDLKHEYDTYKPTYKIVVVFVDGSELYEAYASHEERNYRISFLQQISTKFKNV